MNVLLTGTSGFVGSNLLDAIVTEDLHRRHRFLLLSSELREGWEVLIERRELGRYSFSLDDLHARGFSHIDAVIHVGAFIPRRGTETDNINGAVLNVFNTGYLIERLGGSLSRFIFISTIDVYGRSAGMISEMTACTPVGLYGKSKLFCEEVLAAQFGSSPNAAAAGNLQILRLGHIYGPGEEAFEKVIPTTIRNLIRGRRPVLFSAGAELRSFLHVKDCCRLILKSLELPVAPGPINVISRRAISIRDIAMILCDIHREETGEALAPEVQHRIIQTRDYVFDATKMEQYLGYETKDIIEGLREEYKYFRLRYATP